MPAPAPRPWGHSLFPTLSETHSRHFFLQVYNIVHEEMHAWVCVSVHMFLILKRMAILEKRSLEISTLTFCSNSIQGILFERRELFVICDTNKVKSAITSLRNAIMIRKCK